MEGVVAYVMVFVVVGVMLGAALMVMGSMSFGVDCTSLQGYTPVDLGSDGKVGVTQGSSTSGDTPAKFEGWALTCKNAKDSTIQSFGLLAVIMVILAAAVVLIVVRQFT